MKRVDREMRKIGEIGAGSRGSEGFMISGLCEKIVEGKRIRGERENQEV